MLCKIQQSQVHTYWVEVLTDGDIDDIWIEAAWGAVIETNSNIFSQTESKGQEILDPVYQGPFSCNYSLTSHPQIIKRSWKSIIPSQKTKMVRKIIKHKLACNQDKR